MREEIIKHILERLEAETESIKADFQTDKEINTKFTAIDNLLPEDLAQKIYESFPENEKMTLLNSFREKKFTSKQMQEFDPLIEDITFAFQDEKIIKKIGELTGIKEAVGDPKLYAGGISKMIKGHFLNPHLDNSHDVDQKNYRVLNLLYYVTPDWKEEFGGNLELWNEDVTDFVEMPSKFNRLVLMSTNDKSWHSVNEIKQEGERCCVSNYYFSKHSPNGYETTHVTYFKARPEQKIRRILTEADSSLRTLLRRVKKTGFGKNELYEKEKSK